MPLYIEFTEFFSDKKKFTEIYVMLENLRMVYFFGIMYVV